MTFARKFADAFAELFRGNNSVRGVHVPDKGPFKAGEKAKGKSFTKTEPLLLEHYLKHIHGAESIGIVPIDKNHNIRFAAIDVDVYPLNPVTYLKILKRAQLPLMGFRSKSGGLHLYCFFSEDTLAEKAVPLIQQIRVILGLPKDTEVFPKQTRLIGTGNYINIPYFNYKNTARYAYSLDGSPMAIEEAIETAMLNRVTLKELTKALEHIPLSEAPPCLQALYLQGGPDKGGRNSFLFNCAVYLKARFGDDFGNKLQTLNSKIDFPIDPGELENTVISSHKKGEYSYQCSDGTLKECCDKDLCKLRHYGKGAGNVSDLSFERLVQVVCSQPYYKWTINGVDMFFYTETELMNQGKFRELCLRYLHHVPCRLKDAAWSEILNRALNSVVVEESTSDDMSGDSLWLGKVEEFFSTRKAAIPSAIEEGLVWQDDKDNMWFKGSKLLEHLEKSGMFRSWPKSMHHKLLREMGADSSKKLRMPEIGQSNRGWYIPLKTLQKNGIAIKLRGKDEEKIEQVPIDYKGESKF